MDKDKIDRAIKLLQSFKGDEIELSFSGGKDSCVILELAKMANIPYRAIYKSTTIDPPGTIKFCKEMGAEIIMPDKSFFQLIAENGFPSLFQRFCCKFLKEYKVLDNSIQGIRRCESSKRASNYKEPIMCRVYGSKKNHVNVFLPILDWTNNDIYDFITERKIQLHPLYYDKDGKIDITKRLGCLACPMNKNRLDDFKQYPNLVKAYIHSGQKWWNKERDKPMKCQSRFGSIYEKFVCDVFFHDYQSFIEARDGMFAHIDCKKFLENYFKIQL